MAKNMDKYPVSYFSEAGDRFVLQKADEKLVFNRIPSGLYLHYVEDRYILMGATTTCNHKG